MVGLIKSTMSKNGQLLDSNVMQLLLSMQNYYAKTLDAARQQYMRELENKDKQYRDILTDKNRWLRRMFFCLIGMLAVMESSSCIMLESSNWPFSLSNFCRPVIASSEPSMAATIAATSRKLGFSVLPLKMRFTVLRGTPLALEICCRGCRN